MTAARYHYSGPSVDHTILSPSGRVSRRARSDALDRERARLFPEGYWDAPAKSANQERSERAKALRASARNLRDLAERGMSARKLRKAADALDAQANALEVQP